MHHSSNIKEVKDHPNLYKRNGAIIVKKNDELTAIQKRQNKMKKMEKQIEELSGNMKLVLQLLKEKHAS